VALVAVVVAARLWAALGLDAPWIAPDEMLYGMLGRSFWETGHQQLLDGRSPFYGIYPYLAGAPLAAFGTSTGVVVVKVLQALLLALPVLVVYIWTRGLARARWALAAAAMTAALPAGAYSGLVMTEISFLAVSTIVLWRLWATLLEPSRRNQLIVLAATTAAVAIRLKAAILLVVIVAAVGLMAYLTRDARLVRRFRPTALVLAGVVLLGVLAVAVRGRGGLGGYSVVAGHGYALGTALRWIAYEGADMLLLVLGIPVVAVLALTVASLQRRVDESVRALVAVTLPYCILLVVEVGIFVSRFETRLNERTLFTVAPPLFVGLAVWLDRGLPRSRRWLAVIAFGLILAGAFWPVQSLVQNGDLPDSFTTIPLFDLMSVTSAHTLRIAWIAGLVVAIALAALLPRRFGWVLAVLVVAGLASASYYTQSKIDLRASQDRAVFFGTSSPDWVDHAAGGPVVYLDDDPLWNGSWQIAFWNRKIERVAAMKPPVSTRPDNLAAAPRDDGTLLDAAGAPLGQRFVLAPQTMTLVGRELRRIRQAWIEPGLALWQTPSSPRLSTWISGTLPQPVTLDAYSCQGSLYLTVAAPAGATDALVSVTGLTPTTVPVPAGRRLRLAIPSPPGAPPTGRCEYTIRTDGTMTLKGVAFHRGAAPHGPAAVPAVPGATSVVRLGGSAVPGYRAPSTPTHRPSLAFCVDGNFQMLPAGPHTGATQASFVQGTGLTCVVPPGYVQQGYASEDVPPGIYPLYVPPTG
jgi:hypothetical protein